MKLWWVFGWERDGFLSVLTLTSTSCFHPTLLVSQSQPWWPPLMARSIKVYYNLYKGRPLLPLLCVGETIPPCSSPLQPQLPPWHSVMHNLSAVILIDPLSIAIHVCWLYPAALLVTVLCLYVCVCRRLFNTTTMALLCGTQYVWHSMCGSVWVISWHIHIVFLMGQWGTWVLWEFGVCFQNCSAPDSHRRLDFLFPDGGWSYSFPVMDALQSLFVTSQHCLALSRQISRSTEP